MIEAETMAITTHNLEALISQITLHQSPIDQNSSDSTSQSHQESDQKTEDEHANDKEEDSEDDMSDTSTSSASTFSSPIWTPLEVFDFSKHDQVIADISTHLQTYEAMALDLGLDYSYAAAVLEQEDMREDGEDQHDGVVSFNLHKQEEGDDDDDDDEDMAMLVAREVRYWQAQMDHGMSYYF
ncbi:hypothetical protein MMC31_000417 [Peltigera leucophlebia]|nr:hypothetical protein [Peltigera leucophlebia]